MTDYYVNPAYKKFYRSRRERMIAGVCGGLAEHFHTDPTWVRLVFILLFIFGGGALVIYLIMWLIVPLAPLIHYQASSSYRDASDHT